MCSIYSDHLESFLLLQKCRLHWFTVQYCKILRGFSMTSIVCICRKTGEISSSFLPFFPLWCIIHNHMKYIFLRFCIALVKWVNNYTLKVVVTCTDVLAFEKWNSSFDVKDISPAFVESFYFTSQSTTFVLAMEHVLSVVFWYLCVFFFVCRNRPLNA